jgi:hypothetical protein
LQPGPATDSRQGRDRYSPHRLIFAGRQNA